MKHTPCSEHESRRCQVGDSTVPDRGWRAPAPNRRARRSSYTAGRRQRRTITQKAAMSPAAAAAPRRAAAARDTRVST